MYLRYGPARDFLYNMLLSIINGDTLILKALGFSPVGISPLSIYFRIGWI